MVRLCDTCVHKGNCFYRKEVMEMASKYWYEREIYFSVTDCKYYKEEIKK